MDKPEKWDDLRPEVKAFALAMEERLQSEDGAAGKDPLSHAADGQEHLLALLRSLDTETRYSPSAAGIREQAVRVATAMLQVTNAYHNPEG